jgi:hypothetical protein
VVASSEQPQVVLGDFRDIMIVMIEYLLDPKVSNNRPDFGSDQPSHTTKDIAFSHDPATPAACPFKSCHKKTPATCSF